MDYNQDYYGILGVTPDADHVVVRAAYKALIYKYHPDRNKEPATTDIVTQLTEAISVVCDKINRLNYDIHRSHKFTGAQPTPYPSEGLDRDIRGGWKNDRLINDSSPFSQKRATVGIAGLVTLIIIFFITLSYVQGEAPLPPPNSKAACNNDR